METIKETNNMASDILDDESSDTILSEESIDNIFQSLCGDSRSDQSTISDYFHKSNVVEKLFNRQVCFTCV